MFDLAAQPMGFYGGLTAAVVFGIFIGSWWFYGMRTYAARRMIHVGNAVLVDIDTADDFASARVDGARNIPLEELEDRVWELGSRRRTVVLCGTHAVRGYRAASRLRDLGYPVINLGSILAEGHA